MAQKLVNESSLISVADAIRAKTGTGGSLAFPEGFVSAINGITVGSDDDTPSVPYVDFSFTVSEDTTITAGTNIAVISTAEVTTFLSDVVFANRATGISHNIAFLISLDGYTNNNTDAYMAANSVAVLSCYLSNSTTLGGGVTVLSYNTIKNNVLSYGYTTSSMGVLRPLITSDLSAVNIATQNSSTKNKVKAGTYNVRILYLGENNG